MPTAPSGSVVLDQNTPIRTTEPITQAPAPTPYARTSLVSGRNRVWAALVTFLVVVGAFLLGLFVATWSTNEAAPEISTVRMSQPAWQQYRTGERDSHAVIHPVNSTWQQYRVGERLAW